MSVCVQRCQKFVQNYRVAMPPICYNVVGRILFGIRMQLRGLYYDR